ncbi:MAG TPA: ATP-binding protein, partial [Telluria sp.]|nr:ATP-binding protein [Telluria sp.]
TSVVERLEAGKEHRRQVFVILSELFTNAVEHGLLGLDSSLKGGVDGFEAYMAERQRRLDALDGGHVEIGLERALIDGRAAIRIRVRDTGQGFDYGALDLAAFGQNATPYGRGILLASSLCYSLEFVGAGNEVVGYYCL